MRPKHSGSLSVILGLGPEKRHGSPDKEDDSEELPPEDDGEDDGEDFEAMASEVLDAIEAKDPKALAESLRGFVESCR